jgi:hypothetical protein
MSKVDKFLKALKENVGEWTCCYCNSGSDQPAATFREIKKRGYIFEEVGNNRWAKTIFCPICNGYHTHYKLLFTEKINEEKPRCSITPKQRDRVIKILKEKDAFTGAKITSTPEIDHKVPWSRLDKDINISNLSDEEIAEHFQLLTREHNLLKDRECQKCIKTNIRPHFFEIPFWYEGDEKYNGSCEGCGYYDGKKWRKELKEKLF